MSKATFYRLPVKSKTVHRPRRRQRPAEQPVEQRLEPRQATQSQPVYHPAPQFRRNRRFWLRRLGLDKGPR